MPDTYVIVFCLILLTILLSYMIPAGSYNKLVNGAGQSIGIDPASFHFIQTQSLSLKDIFCSLYMGLVNGAKTIFLVFIIGGVFQVIIHTGTLNAIINVLIKKLGRYEIVILPLVMFFLFLMGVIGIGLNVALVFIPIGIILCKKLRLDSIVVVAIFLLAANTGFSTSPLNPFTVLLAQDIAQVAYMSGFVLRTIFCIISFVFLTIYVMRYCAKIRKISAFSLVGIYSDAENDASDTSVTPQHLIIALALIFAFSWYAWGSVKYNWGLDILSGIMVALGLFSATVAKMSPNDVSAQFVDGCKQMVFSAMLIGLAGAITVIMSEAKIIDTIVYYLCLPLIGIHNIFAGALMCLLNAIINVFIPSGSGQAYVTIPIMAPMADVLGFSKQVAISAFQYGDGFTNSVIPTSSLLLGCLGIAGVPFYDWLKFAFPLYLIMMTSSVIFIVFAILIGWA